LQSLQLHRSELRQTDGHDFEKTQFHLVLKWHMPALTLWKNAAMNDLESGWIRAGGRFRHNDQRKG
jgi:hypothetical protein